MDSSPPSRRSSIANSTLSHTGSTHPMLAGMKGPLDPPNVPFASSANSQASFSRSGSPSGKNVVDASSVSLTVNYLPSKFSNSLLSPGARRRKGGKDDPVMPKRGGGVEAFKSGEARMPGQNDEDYDGVSGGFFGGDSHRKLRWNKFKWMLFVANCFLTLYSLIALVFCLLTWFDIWTNADVIRVGNRTELIISTLAASIGIFTSLIGWAGILLNNRCFLAIYSFLLWITFIFLVMPGYMTYKRRTFNLEGKVNAQWSRNLGASGRLRIQNQLKCCGYFSPYVEATVSQTCYARSILEGCKAPYIAYERIVLARWYAVSFGLVPLHIAIMVIGLLCSNHVTYRFGKGMMPKAYRLSMNSMAVIMDNYANQLAEQYGSDVASEIIARSRSNLQLDTMPTMPYPSGQNSASHNKYDSVGGRAPEGAT
ncbi:tetraspanin Tsp2 [Collybia nuda]|uniref:Tetraspanin Tsp2 n=1 Tax=Collybia nuda TaxID=64659 RepID=A0A9P5XV01_9AGAR|nr:tetraspanin Tsp2 [Collybia nuda]